MSEQPNSPQTCTASAVCSWRMNCRLDEVRSLAAAARTLLLERQISPADAEACELALVEACNNAVQYTPPSKQSMPIEIAVFLRPDVLEIHITDRTEGFDFPAAIELPAPEEEHGRGLFIIRSVMNHVSYLRGQNENRLV